MDFLQWLSMQQNPEQQAMGNMQALQAQSNADRQFLMATGGMPGPQQQQPPFGGMNPMRPQMGPHMSPQYGASQMGLMPQPGMGQGMPYMGGMGQQQPDARRQLIMQLLQQGMAPQQPQGAPMPPAPLPMGRPMNGGMAGGQPMTGQLMQQMSPPTMGRRPLGGGGQWI
jgi:hypothetical protein